MHLVFGKGVPVNARDPERNWGTSLHIAASKGREEAVEALLNLGADAHMLDNSRSTPLHLAAERGASHVCMMLLEAGCDVDAQDEDGLTPLHRAASVAQVTTDGDILATCRVLISNGSRIGTRDLEQMTPLHAASEHGNADVVRELLERGADPSAVDHRNETALEKAKEVRMSSKPRRRVMGAAWVVQSVWSRQISHQLMRDSLSRRRSRMPLKSAAASSRRNFSLRQSGSTGILGGQRS